MRLSPVLALALLGVQSAAAGSTPFLDGIKTELEAKAAAVEAKAAALLHKKDEVHGPCVYPILPISYGTWTAMVSPYDVPINVTVRAVGGGGGAGGLGGGGGGGGTTVLFLGDAGFFPDAASKAGRRGLLAAAKKAGTAATQARPTKAAPATAAGWVGPTVANGRFTPGAYKFVTDPAAPAKAAKAVHVPKASVMVLDELVSAGGAGGPVGSVAADGATATPKTFVGPGSKAERQETTVQLLPEEDGSIGQITILTSQSGGGGGGGGLFTTIPGPNLSGGGGGGAGFLYGGGGGSSSNAVDLNNGGSGGGGGQNDEPGTRGCNDCSATDGEEAKGGQGSCSTTTPVDAAFDAQTNAMGGNGPVGGTAASPDCGGSGGGALGGGGGTSTDMGNGFGGMAGSNGESHEVDVREDVDAPPKGGLGAISLAKLVDRRTGRLPPEAGLGGQEPGQGGNAGLVTVTFQAPAGEVCKPLEMVAYGELPPSPP